jgi:dienelactone hydrolase
MELNARCINLSLRIATVKKDTEDTRWRKPDDEINDMAIHTRTVQYTHEDEVLEAYMAWDDSHTEARPGVLVSHAFRGREAFECGKAEDLARMGYVGFALDLYGKGVVATDADAAYALMQPFVDDRPRLQSRLQACVEAAQSQPEIDASQLAAIGFCFGGMCVLDLARMGAAVQGVCSFHGLLSAAENTAGKIISAQVLVEHGWNDPMVPPAQVLDFAAEMTAAEADWTLHAHGHTLHSFTNPAADNPAGGTAYRAEADRRSWRSMQNFLVEVFGGAVTP